MAVLHVRRKIFFIEISHVIELMPSQGLEAYNQHCAVEKHYESSDALAKNRFRSARHKSGFESALLKTAGIHQLGKRPWSLSCRVTISPVELAGFFFHFLLRDPDSP
jgi:hypothetical protein